MSNIRGKDVKHFQSFRPVKNLTSDSVRILLSSLNTPRSLTVWLLFSSGEHDQLTELTCEPEHYTDPYRFRDDFLATSFLSKANFLQTSFNRETVAMDKFFKFEEQCRETNRRFKNLCFDPIFFGVNCELLEATRSKIAQILGSFSGDEWFDSGGWGPGVTTQLKGSYVSAINKFHLENGITPDLYALVGNCFDVAYPGWAAHMEHLYGSSQRWSFQKGNTVCTVPKNSKTNRVIAVEPGINLWFQKAIGSMIRRRLLRFSIDLNTQENNQRLAYSSSKDGRLATVDFSSASDSISSEVVRYLIPNHPPHDQPDPLPRDVSWKWLMIMESCRSEFGVLKSGAHRWEKFSSMGNGFTFELESLIFYAAACAVHRKLGISTSSISVYGDDVILDTRALDLFSSFTKFLGFTINQKKSFSTGYFRESCGSYYWDGIDVKPIFLKERINNVEAVYKLANGIRNLAHRRNSYYGCDRMLLATHRHLSSRLPRLLRLRVPRSLGDVGLASNFDEACPPRAKGGIEGYRIWCLHTTSQKDYLDSPAVLLARLWYPSMREMNNSYALRGRTKRVLAKSLVSQWYDYGPWF